MFAADFRILGRLEVTIDGLPVPVPAAKHRILLAALLIRANQVVTTDELVGWLWPGAQPGNPKATLQTYVQRLRNTLRNPQRVTTVPDGYRLVADAAELDVARFRSLAQYAAVAPDLAGQADLLNEALAQWRGEVLADVPCDPLRQLEVPHLEQERLEVLERRFDVELRLGRHAGLIRELQAVTDEHPLRERFSAQLILALYRSGRQADAFAAFHRVKGVLAEQLGVDPAEELRSLYQAILTNDPSVAAPRHGAGELAAAAVRQRLIPRELPANVRDFVGRERVQGQIVELLSGGAGQGVPLVVLSGPPGAGKTALAVRTGHELADRFPDGQLYADLRGHSLTAGLSPTQVMSRFLISLGVPGQQVPSELDQLTTMYRTLLADSNVLVLLDNVATAGQVRPLLPNTEGSAVIITSRNELRGLSALQGARLVKLDVLGPGQSLRLLTAIVGPERIDVDPEAAAELADLCGHLPLALRIAAANLTARVGSTVSEFAGELRQSNRLAKLTIEGDEEAAVLVAFKLSYDTLGPQAARLFRLLGLIPGPDFTVVEATALIGKEDNAQRLLDQLAAANLVDRQAVLRYQLHDLLRLYAVERCRREETGDAVTAARERLYRSYLRRVDAAAEILYPIWLRLPRPAVADDEPHVAFTGSAEATAWMDLNFRNVTAAIVDAARHGPATYAWLMAESTRSYLVTRGRYRDEGLAACVVALRAAVDEKAPLAEAAMHNTLAAVHNRHADYPRALRHFKSELRAQRAAGHVAGKARALIALGNVHQAIGKLDEAAAHIKRGLELAYTSGSALVSCLGWLNLSFVEVLGGKLDQAEKSARAGLRLCGENGGRVAEAECHSILGEIMLRRGEHELAIRHFTEALRLYRERAVSHYEADVLGHLANAYLYTGEYAVALKHAELAVRLARDAGAAEEEVDALTTLASIHHRLGLHTEALRSGGEALALARGIGYTRGDIAARHSLADTNRAVCDLAAAMVHAEEARALSERAGFQTLHGQSETLLAWIKLDAGHESQARTHAGAAAEIHDETGALLDQARALHVLGVARQAMGNESAAQECWLKALSCLPSAETPDTAELRRLLAACADDR